MSAKKTAKVQSIGRPKKVSREQIVSAALSVMEKEGFAALSMRSLARELGINHATLYNYIDHIRDVEQEALDALLARIPMPDASKPEPLRQQLIEHLLAVRQTQILFPKFCHAPPGTPTWRLQMQSTSHILDVCCDKDEQIERMAVAYNTLISVVAHSAEHSRAAGVEAAGADLRAIAELPRDEFEPLFRPLEQRGKYTPELASFVYRLDYLIGCLAPHIPPLQDELLQALDEAFEQGVSTYK